MTSINKKLWQWLFEHNEPSTMPPFNPSSARLLNNADALMLTGIRRRGLFLRKTYGKAGRALTAVCELATLPAIPKRPARNDAPQGIVGGLRYDVGREGRAT